MFDELRTQLATWLQQSHDTTLVQDLRPLLTTGRDVDVLGAAALLDLHESLTPKERAAFNRSVAKGKLPSLPKKAPTLWLETHPEVIEQGVALTRDFLLALYDDFGELEQGLIPCCWPDLCERREQASALMRLLDASFPGILLDIDWQGDEWVERAEGILFEGSEMLQRSGASIVEVWWVQNLLIYNT